MLFLDSEPLKLLRWLIFGVSPVLGLSASHTPLLDWYIVNLAQPAVLIPEIKLFISQFPVAAGYSPHVGVTRSAAHLSTDISKNNQSPM